MTNLNAVLLGLIQGLTEFLPVSSSGHLVIFQNLLRLPDSEQYITYDILLHLGTLISVLFFYWKDVLVLIVSFFDLLRGKADFKSARHRFLMLLIIGTLPLVAVFLVKNKVETLFGNPLLVGCALLITGCLLFMTDRLKKGEFAAENMPYKNALIIGLFQLFAVLPGISRSGSTIFGGVLTGLKKEFAVKFSLLLSIFAILGASAASVPDILSGEGMPVPAFQCVLGLVVSAVSGIAAIKFLVSMLGRNKFKYFAFYCWIVGIITIIVSV